MATLSFNEKTQKIKDLNESKLLDKKMIDDIKLLDILKREIFLNLDKVSFEIDFYLDLVWRFNPSNYLFEVKNFILNYICTLYQKRTTVLTKF